MKTGTHPDCLKLVMVIPIHKKRSKLEVGDYRPISLLLNIDKLLEKIVHERTYNFLKIFLKCPTSISMVLEKDIQQIMHSLRLLKNLEKPCI